MTERESKVTPEVPTIVEKIRLGEGADNPARGDCFFINKEKRVMGLFAASRGNLAPEIGNSYSEKELSVNIPNSPIKIEELEKIIANTFKGANEAIKERNEGDPQKESASGTLGVIAETEKPNKFELIFGNLGNNRILLHRKTRVLGTMVTSLQTLTLDDSKAWEKIKNRRKAMEKQEKLSEVSDVSTLKKQEKEQFQALMEEKPTQVLGQTEINPQIGHITIRPSDRILIISDDVWKNLRTSEDIKKVLDTNSDNDKAAKEIYGKVYYTHSHSTSSRIVSSIDGATVLIISPVARAKAAEVKTPIVAKETPTVFYNRRDAISSLALLVAGGFGGFLLGRATSPKDSQTSQSSQRTESPKGTSTPEGTIDTKFGTFVSTPKDNIPDDLDILFINSVNLETLSLDTLQKLAKRGGRVGLVGLSYSPNDFFRQTVEAGRMLKIAEYMGHGQKIKTGFEQGMLSGKDFLSDRSTTYYIDYLYSVSDDVLKDTITRNGGAQFFSFLSYVQIPKDVNGSQLKNIPVKGIPDNELLDMLKERKLDK